jgi:uncharacterized FlaG/YvyC family protein
MEVIRKRYSPANIKALYNTLKELSDKGNPQEYKILVDGVEAVPRTDNLDLFDIYTNLIDETTYKIEVFVYSTSKNASHYLYVLDDDLEQAALEKRRNKEQSLSGIELQDTIQSAIEDAKNKWDKENEQKRILEENHFLKQENAELEKENEDLEEQVEQLTEQLNAVRSPLHGMLGQLGSTLIETVAKRNQHLLKLIPGGEALNGFLLSENENKALQSAQQEPETEVSFRAKEPQEAPKLEDLLSEDDKLLLTLIRQMRFAFEDGEMRQVMQILNSLVMDKSNIQTVLELLTENSETTEETENNEGNE